MPRKLLSESQKAKRKRNDRIRTLYDRYHENSGSMEELCRFIGDKVKVHWVTVRRFLERENIITINHKKKPVNE